MVRATAAVLAAGLLAIPHPSIAQGSGRLSGGPAERRLMELVTAVQSGSTERIRAYVREAYAPELRQRINEDAVVQFFARLHDRSHGFEIDSLHATPTEAVALLRTKLTGTWEQLSVRVEPEPPHRLLASASSRIAPPRHRLAGDGASDAARVREIARIARRLAEADAFSGVALLARGDSILYLDGFGQADRSRRAAIRPDTRFQLASITKPFVSVAVAQLVEAGRLSWDDSLGKLFPDLPLAAARQRVRIRHLVTHTSGLRDFSCEGRSCPTRYDSTDDHLRAAVLSQGDSLVYEPGSRFVYTNTNYALLGRIVELLSGQTLHDYVRAHVFRPAGMQDTDFFEPGRAPERLAVGYDKQFSDEGGVRYVGEPVRPESTGYGSPHAGAYSTARDLFRFARALQSGRLLRPETVALIFSPKPEAGSWGYGFEIYDEARGLVGHGGSWRGISNGIDLFTRSGYTSVILSSYTDARSPLREAIRAMVP